MGIPVNGISYETLYTISFLMVYNALYLCNGIEVASSLSDNKCEWISVQLIIARKELVLVRHLL